MGTTRFIRCFFHSEWQRGHIALILVIRKHCLNLQIEPVTQMTATDFSSCVPWLSASIGPGC